MLTKFELTQQDIDGGCKHAAENCAYARAFMRRFQTNCRIWVGWNTDNMEVPVLVVKTPHFDKDVRLTEEIRVQINRFDAGKPIHPHEFYVDLPHRLSLYLVPDNHDRRIEMKPQRTGALVTA